MAVGQRRRKTQQVQNLLYLTVLYESQSGLVVGGDLRKQRTLRQQHKGEQGVEGTQCHHQVQAGHPVAGGVGPPGEPSQEEGEGIEGGAVQDGQAPLRTAAHFGVVLQVAEERVVDRIPYHEDHLQVQVT